MALPVALIAFRIFFGDVIAPNTGVDAGFLEQNCDRILRAQLQARRDVVTVAQAKGLIGAIQRDKSECAPENWMGPATTALFAPSDATCGLTAASALVIRTVAAADTGGGYSRTGGAIVISFKTADAGQADALWSGEEDGLLGIRSFGRGLASWTKQLMMPRRPGPSWLDASASLRLVS